MSAGYEYETRVCAVDSRLRTSGTTADFVVTLPEQINVLEYAFVGAAFPISSYNVRTGVNNTLVTSLGTATVAAGSYTGAQLATALQAAMIATVHASSLVTFSGTSGAAAGKFTISRTGNFGIDFAANPNGLRRALGFSATALTGAATYTSDLVADLSHPAAFFVASSALAGGGGSSLISGFAPPSGGTAPLGSIVQKIALGGATFGGKSAWDSSLDRRGATFTVLGRNVREIDIQLYDEEYRPADLNGQDCTLEILFRTSRDRK